MVIKKTCFKCGVERPILDFYKHPQMADGHINKCKDCTKDDVQKNYRKNIDHYKRYEELRSGLPHRVKDREEYSKSEHGKKIENKIKYKWKKNNSEKVKAMNRVNNSIPSGKIIKQPCSVCGSTYRIHGHHEDYSKPLEVIWLCPSCHKLHHLKRKQSIKEKENGRSSMGRF